MQLQMQIPRSSRGAARGLAVGGALALMALGGCGGAFNPSNISQTSQPLNNGLNNGLIAHSRSALRRPVPLPMRHRMQHRPPSRTRLHRPNPPPRHTLTG